MFNYFFLFYFSIDDKTGEGTDSSTGPVVSTVSTGPGVSTGSPGSAGHTYDLNIDGMKMFPININKFIL